MDIEQRKAKAETIRGREARRCTVPKVELRAVGDALTLDGYASVTGVAYDMGWYTEQIQRGAFAKTLADAPDVQLLINHEGLPLARTLSGTLTLAEDNHGLRVSASLDPADPDVDRLSRKMNRGDIDQMSFAFRAIRQEWDEDYEARELIEVSIDRGDVSVVNQGANPATSVGVRAFGEALLEVRAGATLSSATMDVLTQALGLVATADDAVDEAQVVLSDLMGVANPDDEDGEDDTAARAVQISEQQAKAAAEVLARYKARRRSRVAA